MLDEITPAACCTVHKEFVCKYKQSELFESHPPAAASAFNSHEDALQNSRARADLGPVYQQPLNVMCRIDSLK